MLLCHGATQSRGLRVPGADLGGVEDPTSFLERGKAALAAGQPLPELAPEPGADGGPGRERVVFVLGAGDTAMDVCRTARRLGARVVCLNRRDREHGRVRADELAEAEREGVEVRFETTISAIEGSGGAVTGVRLAPTKQRGRGAPPRVLAHKAITEPADLVVSATGYLVEPAFVDSLPGTAARRKAPPIAPRRWAASGLLMPAAGPDNRRSAIGAAALDREMDLAAARLAFRSRVWVAGDALTGPSTVVEGMAQGREAARAILLGRPRRPGLEPLGGPRRVLVAYESETGHTKQAGNMLGLFLGGAGAEVRAAHLRDVQTHDLAWADLLVIGTWVEGLVVAGVRPARGTRAFLRKLPLMADKKVVLYCTYAVSPGQTLSIMRQRFEAVGAKVVAEGRLSQWSLDAGAARFAVEMLGALWPAVPDFEVADKAKELAASAAPGAAGELRWFAGGRRKLLQDARAVLRQELRGRPDDEAAQAGARLVAEVLSQGTPAALAVRPEGCIA